MGMGTDQFSELSVGDVKLKTTGLRELVAIVTALLIVRLARDGSRVFATTGLGSIGLILAESAKAETHIRNDYARPADLYRALLGDEAQVESRDVKPLKQLQRLETARSALITALASGAAVAVLFAEGKAVWDMLSAPKLAPFLSYSLAIIVCVLIAIAATDVVGILVSRSWTPQRFREVRQRRLRRTEWEEAIAACESTRGLLKYPPRLPEPWPPLSWNELKAFTSIVETAHIAETLQQYWEERKELEEVRGDAGGWPPPSHFPFLDAMRDRYEQIESDQQRKKAEVLATRREKNTQEIERLRKEFDEDFRATANLIGSPSRWPLNIDVYEPYRDEEIEYDDRSVRDFAEKIERNRETLDRWRREHWSIQWCKREVASLRCPPEIPRFWPEDDVDTVVEVVEQIQLAHWRETKSIWSEKRETWIKIPAFSPIRIKALPTALRNTIRTLKAHPAPVQATANIGQMLRKQTWLAIREGVWLAESGATR
jgi:hypothetical protein